MDIAGRGAAELKRMELIQSEKQVLSGFVIRSEKAYPMMKKYAAYLERKSQNHILSYGLGDWFDYGPKQPGESQLTPKGLTATAIYYYDVSLLHKMAKVLGKENDAVDFDRCACDIKKAFNHTFFNDTTF